MKYVIILLITLAISRNIAYSSKYNNSIVKIPYESLVVIDGDTIKDKKTEESVRLAGIDAPELKQKCLCDKNRMCGEESKDFLVKTIGKNQVVCRVMAKDKYKRDIGYCRVNGLDIGYIMVKSGFAIDAYGDDYSQEHSYANESKKGLLGCGFQTPSEYRKTKHRY